MENSPRSEPATPQKRNGSSSLSSLDGIYRDELLGQVKSYAKKSSDFVRKNPLLVLAGACAVGIVGAWALSKKDPS